MTDQEIGDRLLREGLIRVSKLPKLLPHSASGRRAHRSIGWRWVREGLKGPDDTRIRLEAVKIGRAWFTSLAAVGRFLTQLTPFLGNPETERLLGVRDPSRVLAILKKFGLPDGELE